MKKRNLFDIDWKSLIETSTREALSDVLPDEKMQQDKAAAQMRNFKATKTSGKKDVNKNADKQNADEAQDDKPKDSLRPVSPKKSKLPEITLTRIIQKVDSIRAGKSLKNADIKKELNDYYTRLNGNERIALYAFLTGLDKIMGGDTAGEKLPTPKVSPYKIKMRKKSAEEKDSKAAGADDSPIIVGEAANKNREKMIVIKNSRIK